MSKNGRVLRMRERQYVPSLDGGGRIRMIQLTRNGVRDSSNLEALRQEFSLADTLRLPRLLSEDIMAMVAERMASGKWVERVHPGISRELQLEDAKAWQLLHFVTSAPNFLALIGKIVSRDDIASFRGRIYRKLPGRDHRIPWHDDLSDDQGRLVGMSINLGARPYLGGVFKIRRRGSRMPLRILPNTGPGDAILFRIAPSLLHCVTAVEDTEPKNSYAGWFKSRGSDFVATVRERASL